jgi:predicted Zn-dependent protease
MGITVVPIGITDSDILKGLSEGLARTFSQGVRIGREIPLPVAFYNPQRSQYSSSLMLETLRTKKTEPSELILGVTDVDLCRTGEVEEDGDIVPDSTQTRLDSARTDIGWRDKRSS